MGAQYHNLLSQHHVVKSYNLNPDPEFLPFVFAAFQNLERMRRPRLIPLEVPSLNIKDGIKTAFPETHIVSS